MDWFFMTLFLSILERSWVGHFWDFFLKFPKNFTSTIFSTYNPKGGPFYASVRTPFAHNFFVLFWVKNGNNSTSNALIMRKNNQFLPKHAFLPRLNHFDGFYLGILFWSLPWNNVHISKRSCRIWLIWAVWVFKLLFFVFHNTFMILFHILRFLLGWITLLTLRSVFLK